MGKISKALERAELERQRRLEAGDADAEQALTVTETPPEAPPVEIVPETMVDEKLVTLFDPSSPIAEQYRMLRTNLLSLQTEKPLKVIMISSSLHAEGKTISALNLAVTLANDINQRKVLLIDADLRAGTVHKLLGIRPKAGLSDVLAKGVPWREALVGTPLPNLTVMPRGETPPLPAELLASNRMRQLISEIRASYDMCLIDSAPIVPLADPGILGGLADGTLMVVRGGKTQRSTAQYALSLMLQANVRVLGCILTHVDGHMPEDVYRYSS